MHVHYRALNAESLMRAIYLIRHGEPEFKDNRKYCLGQADLPLSAAGVLQAERLKSFIESIPDKTVVSGPLKRAGDTCRKAGTEDYEVRDGFTEINTGEWDGLAFEDIKKKYPEEYAARGRDLLNTAPPGGESFADCYDRVSAEMKKLLEDYPCGNICIFTHEGVMKMLYAFLTGADRGEALLKKYPYCSAACFLADGEKAYEGPVVDPGTDAGLIPDEKECERLWNEYGTPENVRAHCLAVADEAVKICRQLNYRTETLNKAYADVLGGKQAAVPVKMLNEDAVRAAALLHDIARTERDHAKKGALWLNARGYTQVAAIVGDHMSLPEEEERISEKSIVFLADKYIKGTKKVTLHHRYFPEGLAEEQRGFREKKYEQAVRTESMFNE